FRAGAPRSRRPRCGGGRPRGGGAGARRPGSWRRVGPRGEAGGCGPSGARDLPAGVGGGTRGPGGTDEGAGGALDLRGPGGDLPVDDRGLAHEGEAGGPPVRGGRGRGGGELIHPPCPPQACATGGAVEEARVVVDLTA